MDLLLLLIAVLPHDDVDDDRVDIIEVNHFYDEAGRPVFDQVIFWHWHDDGSQHVRAWRLWKTPSQNPWRDRRYGGWVSIWLDGDRLRSIRGQSLRETWTQHDPELDDRQFFPAHLRRGLRGDVQKVQATQPLTP